MSHAETTPDSSMQPKHSVMLNSSPAGQSQALALAPGWAGAPSESGMWEYYDKTWEELRIVEVYESPDGWLAVWSTDIGLVQYEPLQTFDEGHVPVSSTTCDWTGRWMPNLKDEPRG